MSAKTGNAPTRLTASAVAKKVNDGQITSSPAPISSASRARTIASVPLATPSACATPRYSAASRSKASTFAPRMNCPRSRTSSNSPRSSSSSGAYCALTSTSGIGIDGKI